MGLIAAALNAAGGTLAVGTMTICSTLMQFALLPLQGRHAGQPMERVFLCVFPAGQRAGDESREKGKSPLRRQPT